MNTTAPLDGALLGLCGLPYGRCYTVTVTILAFIVERRASRGVALAAPRRVQARCRARLVAGGRGGGSGQLPYMGKLQL